MTVLSVNLNKLALLRNSRGRNYPDVLDFAARFIRLGVQGLTIHPRPDERHIRRSDAYELAELLQDHPGVEFNIEGYPTEAFLQLVTDTRPQQCTLVPDADGQLTSDHGWDCHGNRHFLQETIMRLRSLGVRVAVFLDPDPLQPQHAAEVGADRIELYTEAYAQAWGTSAQNAALQLYRATAAAAQALGMGVNAGHDLNLANLGAFLHIPAIMEVSIGHALTIESIEQGMDTVVRRYLDICRGAA